MEESCFDDKYEIIGDAIGQGHFATVFKCCEKSTNNFYAAKRIRHARNTLSKTGAQQSDIDREINTLKSLDHPNIIKLYDVFADAKVIGRNGKVSGKETILILELVEGGELFKKICEEEVACETDAIFYLRQILEGLRHMHSKKIIHLDIKPENIMLDKSGENIKIIDFGLARDLSTDSNIDYRMAGTVPYFAPERINADPVSPFSDMWSLGVVACILLTGINPFECTDQDLPLKTRQQETTSNITKGDLDLESEYFYSTSENGKDFIRSLLQLNANNRMSAEECLQHPWMVDEILTNHRRRSSQLNVKNLRSFMAKERWKSAVYSIRECLTINKRLSLPTHLIDNHKESENYN